VKVLVDTSVWSLALRRKSGDLNPQEYRLTEHLADLIRDDRVMVIGPIRQELLSGIRSAVIFERLKRRLRHYDDEPLTSADYESAAEFGNTCRTAGISGSAIDFLMCAAANRRGVAILTTDRDFSRYAATIPVRLHAIDTHR
jgi:predicted nucleic acid-binding protein